MRRLSRLLILAAFLGIGLLQAKPDRTEEPKPEPAFKPVEIKNELTKDDPNDEKLKKPAKKFTVKLTKDKAYVVELASSDFEPYLRFLDKSGGQLAEDLAGGIDTSRLVINIKESGDHHIVVTAFNDAVGKFVLKVREVKLQGEAKVRDIGKKGLEIDDQVAEKDVTDLGKFSKVVSVNLKAGKSYLIDADSQDFDCEMYLFDAKNKLHGQDHARLFHSPTADGEQRIVISAFDNKDGKFSLKLRELNIKGEPKPRAIGKTGFKHNDDVGEKNMTDLGDYSRTYSVELKAGQSYMFDIKSDDFDTQLYVFDGKSKLLAQDHAKVFHVPTKDGVHHLVVKAFDNKEGKFNLDVQEFNLKGEAKPRELGKNGLTVKGQINANDDTPIGKVGKVFSVELKAGQTYTIELNSADLDSYLYLFDAKNALLAQDDDSGGDLNSRVVFRAERDGVYHIIATSLGGMDTGEFTLKVRKRE
jgi:hypothetical protein